jgi:hypothetical protein
LQNSMIFRRITADYTLKNFARLRAGGSPL